MRYTPDWYAADTRFDVIADYIESAWTTVDTRHVLDFGAFTDRIAQRFVARFGSHVVAVDPNLTYDPPEGVEFIADRLGPAQIRKLGHQDVTLALSVLHHQRRWKATLNALAEISDTLFVEAAHPDEVLPDVDTHTHSAAIIAELDKRGTVICETPGWDGSQLRPLYALHHG